MSCPRCQSDDWKLASLVNREGITHVATKSGGVGVGYYRGRFGVGVGGGSTDGTHQTQLSKLAAPPTGDCWQKYLSILLLAGAFLLGAPCFLERFFEGYWIWELVVSAAVCLIAALCLMPSAFAKLEAEMAIWRSLRMCQRCGAFYSPPGSLDGYDGGHVAAQKKPVLLVKKKARPLDFKNAFRRRG
jgi:hypothetical protein